MLGDLPSLLAFLGIGIHGNYNANRFMLNFTEELHMRPHVIIQKGVSGIKHFHWAKY